MKTVQPLRAAVFSSKCANVIGVKDKKPMDTLIAEDADAGVFAEGYSTKRYGLTLANCDSEPVHTPGCVQAHGVLMVVRRSDLHILQVSDNVDRVLGRPIGTVLGQSVGNVIGLEGQQQLINLLEKEPVDCNPLYLLTLPCPHGDESALDVTVHTVGGVVIVEFESTARTSGSVPDYYGLVKKTVARLQTTGSLQEFCAVVAAEIRNLAGMDRVMIYKFHADGHGEVLSESRRTDLPTWLGLHYPAEDIPKPARAIFSKTWIRPVPDVTDALAELVPLLNPDTGKPLDMTYCALRGVSIMYTEYLSNMGVAAALTMAIRRDQQLWGLIACHHYAAPKFVPYQVRAACEFLAQVVSLQLQAAEDRNDLAYRLKIAEAHQKILATVTLERGLVPVITGTPSLLEGINAGGVALYYLDRWWLNGDTPSEEQLESLGDWLTDAMLPVSSPPLYVTDRLAETYAPALAFLGVASGLLAVPVSSSGRDLLLWFRPETIHTVNWGGSPHDKPTVPGPNGPRLTPRHSFELFVQSVQQRSLPWTATEIAAAVELRFLEDKIGLGRTVQRAGSLAELIRSNEELDAFAYVASHDLKEPLRGIHQYAHQLLAEVTPVDEDSRVALDSLVRLTLRMDSLLDSLLHFSRVGGSDLALEVADLNQILADALDVAGLRSSDGKTTVAVPRPLLTVRCNPMRCRQIFVNLLSNAVKYTDAQQKRIEVGYILPAESHSRPGCPPGSADQTIYYVADNGIGVEGKHFLQIFKLFKRLHSPDKYGGGTGAGLTIVRKLAEQHGGRVWVDSVVNRGATFYFTLPTRTSPELCLTPP